MSRKLLVSGFVAAAIATATWWLFASPVVVGSPGDSFLFDVRSGESFNAIVEGLQSKGILRDETRPRLIALLLGLRNKLKAGRYEIRGATSGYGLLSQLLRGGVATEVVTIREGLQSRQIASILARTVNVDSAAFMNIVRDSASVLRFGVEGKDLEGYLFPNTYHFHWGIKARRAIGVMLKEFKRQVSDSLLAVMHSRGMTLHETLTLASIIEGEAVVDSERAIISAVYHNRLRRKMLLQADPTIQFVIVDGPRRLLHRDLKIKSPYNTYIYPGLPPGPISNPGRASIVAAINPAKVGYLYFVAKGDGSHYFSRTLREHNRAKARFDQYRRKVRRERRKSNR